MELLCIKCKGRTWCGKPCKILEKIKQFSPKKVNLDFSGSSPPELFVGHFNYPNVFTGILAPTEYNEEAFKLGSPEEWFKEKLQIEEILANRGSMIYSRFITNVKSKKGKLLETMQEVSMAKKPCAVEFHLVKKPQIKIDLDIRFPPIGNPAPLKKAKLEENPSVAKKVDYFVSDNEIKAEEAIIDLHKHNFSITSMIKLLSAGLLGIKIQRKLTPSRWSTTAVDSTVSKNLMRKIRTYPWINEFQVFYDEYIGNHYEILLIPRQWSFEVIEAKIPGSVWNPIGIQTYFMQDYENYWNRKTYAANVSGAYYANRVGVCEYLNKIKKQASILVLREVKESYWAPCGVGILRETTRSAFRKKPKKFNNFNEALSYMQTRLQLPIKNFIEKSMLLKEFKQQSTLKHFI